MTDPLDTALDAAEGPGEIQVDEEAGSATIDLVEADRIGVRVRGVRVGHAPKDMAAEAEALPERLRAIPARLKAVEVDTRLGGASFRTAPDQIRRGRYFELQMRPEETEVKRYRVVEGERRADEFTLTRDQLRDLIDEVRGDD